MHGSALPVLVSGSLPPRLGRRRGEGIVLAGAGRRKGREHEVGERGRGKWETGTGGGGGPPARLG